MRVAEQHNGRVKKRKKDSDVVFIYSYMNTEGRGGGVLQVR